MRVTIWDFQRQTDTLFANSLLSQKHWSCYVEQREPVLKNIGWMHNRSYKNDEIDVAELPISGITLELT